MIDKRAIKRLKIICCIIAFLCTAAILVDIIFLIMQINDGTLTSKFTGVPEEAQKGTSVAGLALTLFAIMPLVLLSLSNLILYLLTSIKLSVSVLKKENSGTQILVYISAIFSTLISIALIAVLIAFTYSLVYIVNIFCVILNSVLVALTIICEKN